MLPRTETTDSNRWRRSYPSPELVHSIGLEAINLLKVDSKTAKSNRAKRRARQHELLMQTGFVGGNAELGHRVAYALRARGYSETVAVFAGHLCAISGCYNFQGNARIAQLMRRSIRTIQRCRALLELEGLVKSCLLEPGQMVDGQRAPVSHAQVIRDVSALQRLASVYSKPDRANRAARRKATSNSRGGANVAANVSKPVPVSAEQLDEIAANAPSFLQGIIAGAAAGKRDLEQRKKQEPARQAAPDFPPPISADEHDAIDAELQQQSERGLRKPDKPPLH